MMTVMTADDAKRPAPYTGHDDEDDLPVHRVTVRQRVTVAHSLRR